MPKRPTLRASLLLFTAALLAPLAMAATPACNDSNHCTQVSAFTAQLTDFRTSVQGAGRRMIATVTFQNLTDRPLIIGYVSGSALGLDEHGNRYTMANSNGVRGIGEIERNRFDSRFTLQAGERADARFELGWHAGTQIAGVDFRLEMAVREIDQVAGDQFRLGREHLVAFSGLSDGLAMRPGTARAGGPAAAVAAVAAPAGNVPVSAATPAAGVVPVADPCADLPRCHAAGPILAEAMQVSASQTGSNHHVQVRVRFRNLGNQPLILAYQQSSGRMLDELGQAYTLDWRYDADVAGIGQVSRNKADPQFVLSPGESRTASFTFRRYVGKTRIGTVYSPDLVIEQLEVLPSQQVRSVREYAIGFTGLGSSQVPAQVQEVGDSLQQLGEGIRSIFKKKK